MSAHSPFELLVPRNGTAVLQHLQRLVGREGHQRWCGGTIPLLKVPGFLEKMADRYPILRNTRERSYDRRRGRAVVHLVVSAPFGTTAHTPPPALLWWLLSDEGTGGLADPAAPDAHVARDAMSGAGHIQVHDYVLMYATKRQPHEVADRRTGKVRRIWADTSTWTFKIQQSVMTEIRTSINVCCAGLEFGGNPSPERAGWGLRGLLAAQRARPLFSGVRNQVITLHEYARETWDPHRPAWVAAHPRVSKEAEHSAGRLCSVEEIMLHHLPIMRQLKTYDTPPRSIGDLLGRSGATSAE
jgi:hypothetical protein